MIEEVGEVWKYDPKYHRVADFLGLDFTDRQNYKVWQKVSYLMDAASKKSKSSDVVDHMHQINKLRKNLGIQAQGETLINSLYEMTRLEQDRQLAQDIKAVEKKEAEEVKKETPEAPKAFESKKDE